MCRRTNCLDGRYVPVFPHELQQPPARSRIIGRGALGAWPGTTDERLAALPPAWIAATVAHGRPERDPQRRAAVAVGRRCLVTRRQDELGSRAGHRRVTDVEGGAVRRQRAYGLYSSGQMAARSGKSCPDSDAT